jgi:hypothetical protein
MQNEKKQNEEAVGENGEDLKPFVEEASWDKPDYVFLPKGNHLWHQEGFFIICNSCDLVHATWIGPDKVLVGIKDGEAVIKTRKELGLA